MKESTKVYKLFGWATITLRCTHTHSGLKKKKHTDLNHSENSVPKPPTKSHFTIVLKHNHGPELYIMIYTTIYHLKDNQAYRIYWFNQTEQPYETTNSRSPLSLSHLKRRSLCRTKWAPDPLNKWNMGTCRYNSLPACRIIWAAIIKFNQNLLSYMLCYKISYNLTFFLCQNVCQEM